MVGCRTRTAAHFCFLVTILVLWATQGICAKKKPPLHPVNLNTASSTELQQVPGIGPATAEKILQARKSYGSFKSVDDLQAIQGIGPKKLSKMRKYLTVGKAAAPTKQASHEALPVKPAVSQKGAPAKPAPPKEATSAASEDEEQ
jgi:competence protein ComEA